MLRTFSNSLFRFNTRTFGPLYRLKPQAIRFYTSFSQDDVNKAKLLSASADNSWQEGHFQDAIEILEDGIKGIHEDLFEEHIVPMTEKLAAMHRHQGDVGKAEQLLSKMLNDPDISLEARSRLMLGSIDCMEQTKAEKFIKDAVRQEEDPITKAKLYQKWADLYYDKAKAMPEDNMTARTLKSIELESAIPLYDKCIELLPKADADLRKEFISAYYNRASSLRKNTEFNDSLAKDELTAVYEKILNDYISINTLDPSLLHIHEHLGDMYAKLEQPVEAIHEYGELDKKLEEFLRSDYANAIKNKDIYVMELYLKLATQYIPKKDFDMCEHYVNSVLESFTKVPGYEERVRQLKAIAHHTVGRCALVMNRYHSCIAHNTKAIAADSSFAPAYRDRIISFEKLDRPDEAIDDKKMLEYITRKIVFERK